MLKLITNNPDTFHRNTLLQELRTKPTSLKHASQNSFLFDVQEFSTNLYTFIAQDLDHGLTVEITLERKERFSCSDEQDAEGYLVPVLACDFPHIDTQKLQEKALGDQYLQGILMFQFQLRILEQLFLFCEEKDAVRLILTIHDADLDYLEIYQRFIVSYEEMITASGEQTEIVISTDIQTYDEVLDFKDKVDINLRQILWHGQKLNPAFRKYLKCYSLSMP